MSDPMKRLVLLGFLGGITWGLLWSVLAPYLRSLGYTGTMYGVLGSTAVLSGAAMTLLGGALSDRIGARKVAAAGLLVQALALSMLSTGSKILVGLGFFMNGAANGLVFTSQQALIARIGSDERLHYTFSYVSASSTFGGAMGSFLGWAPVIASRRLGVPLVDAYSTTILLLALMPVLMAPIALSLPEQLGQATGTGLRARLRGFPRKFYLVALTNVLIGFGAAMSIHNIDYYFAAKYGVTSAELGSVLGAQQLVMAFLMTRMPRLADRYGGVLRVYLLVSYSSVPLLVAMTFTDLFPIAAGLYLVRSVLMNVANPLFNAFIMRMVPRGLRGTASAFLSLSWTIPAGGGRAVGGVLLDIDLELPLRLTALLYTLALTYLTLLFPEEARGGPRTREPSTLLGGPSASRGPL